MIVWADLLQALEGDVVHLPVPKNHCKRDLELSAGTPFLATADALMVVVRGSCVDHTNTEMTGICWRFFHFTKQISPHLQVKLTPCAHCFTKLILENWEYMALEKDT